MLMYDNFLYNPLILPIIPTNRYNPPTLYTLLESMLNYGKDEKIKIKNLAKEGRQQIFDFDYPLSSNIEKAEFEEKILNHFLTRRIGFETFTLFQIELNAKLNEIMPKYNKMFDEFVNWKIFEGETITKTGSNITENESVSNLENSANNKTNNITDRRNSEMPQNRLQDIRDGNYLTDYNYDTAETTSNDNSKSNGTNKQNNKNNYEETIIHTVNNKEEIMKNFETMTSIYTMIYKELDCLFFQVLY